MEDGAEEQKKGLRKFVKVPPTRQNVAFAAVLAFGLALLVTGLCLLANKSFSARVPLLPVMAMAFGAAVLFCALAVSRSGILMFAGLTFLLNGILAFVISSEILPLSLRQLWPVCVVLEGLAVQLSGMYHTRSVRSVYLFPSIMLIILGLCFLLFSLDIIKASLSAVVLRWWPLMLIAVGLVLIVLFVVQQMHHKDFPYMADHSLVEDDE